MSRKVLGVLRQALDHYSNTWDEVVPGVHCAVNLALNVSGEMPHISFLWRGQEAPLRAIIAKP